MIMPCCDLQNIAGYSRVQDDNPTTTSSYEPMMTFSDGASSTKASVPLLEAVEISPPESPREITVYDENEKGEIIPTKIYLSPYISRAEAHLRTLALGVCVNSYIMRDMINICKTFNLYVYSF